jgi:type II secretory pathway component GspD/PulD (secretin)
VERPDGEGAVRCPLLFQAIESITDLEVLSQPSLVTVDNEEASITVGQEVPYVTSQGRTALDEDGRRSFDRLLAAVSTRCSAKTSA